MKVPHYSLFCKRAQEAASKLPRLSNKKPIELLIDSSGLKVLGEGEWKVKIHGADKGRGWVKLHIAVDPKSQELIVVDVTDDTTADSKILPRLVNQAPNSVVRVLADGGYDKASCRNYLADRGIEQCIPPRKKREF